MYDVPHRRATWWPRRSQRPRRPLRPTVSAVSAFRFRRRRRCSSAIAESVPATPLIWTKGPFDCYFCGLSSSNRRRRRRKPKSNWNIGREIRREERPSWAFDFASGSTSSFPSSRRRWTSPKRPNSTGSWWSWTRWGSDETPKPFDVAGTDFRRRRRHHRRRLRLSSNRESAEWIKLTCLRLTKTGAHFAFVSSEHNR